MSFIYFKWIFINPSNVVISVTFLITNFGFIFYKFFPYKNYLNKVCSYAKKERQRPKRNEGGKTEKKEREKGTKERKTDIWGGEGQEERGGEEEKTNREERDEGEGGDKIEEQRGPIENTREQQKKDPRRETGGSPEKRRSL